MVLSYKTNLMCYRVQRYSLGLPHATACSKMFLKRILISKLMNAAANGNKCVRNHSVPNDVMSI